MTSDYHDLRPADPRGLERWREDAAQGEEEFARERRREECDIAGLRIRARAEVVARLRGASVARAFLKITAPTASYRSGVSRFLPSTLTSLGMEQKVIRREVGHPCQ
jgi:hypothetical protein